MPQKNALSAIICEFDPLHYGHRLLLERARAFGNPVVCVMSGNFVQRGGPSMLSFAADLCQGPRCQSTAVRLPGRRPEPRHPRRTAPPRRRPS